MTKTSLLLSVILFSFVAACESRVLPSRGLEVDLSVAETTPVEVAAIADEVFQANGFSLLGQDGYEKLASQQLTVSYSHPKGTLGSVGLNNDEIVPIRINVRTEHWSSEANDFFEQLVLTLESHWPGSVQKEPIPE